MALHDFLDDCAVAEDALLSLGAAIVAAIERDNGYRTAMRVGRPENWWRWRAGVWAVGDA